MIVESLLLEPAKAVIAALTKKAVDAAFAGGKEQSPSEDALRVALGLAVRAYGTTGNNQVLTKPLLGKDGLLVSKDVAEQFAAALIGDESPDAVTIGNEWRKRIVNPHAGVDFTKEAQALIGYFMSQRRWVMGARENLELTVDAQIADNTRDMAAYAAAIDETLTNLFEMLNEGFGIVARRGLQHLRYDQTTYVEEHTREFVGREFVFGEVREAMRTSAGSVGLVTVLAPPGVGKTALMAKFIREKNCVYHFNRRQGGGPTTLPKLLGNICAQLLAKYELQQEPGVPLDQATADSVILTNLLTKIQSLDLGIPPIIAIDALDEMENWRRHGLTFLPEAPAYFVVSMRSDLFSQLPHAVAGLNSVSNVLSIDPLSAANKRDIRRYTQKQLSDPGVRQYIRHHGFTETQFVDNIDDRSEGNFMYLRHVLHAIAHGRLRDRNLKELPSGLTGYYADHLAQMSADGNAWSDYQLPVIAELSVLQQPLTISQISRRSGVSLENVTRALSQWGQFLKPESVRFADGRQRTTFSIYHASFQEFLAESPLIRDYRDALADGLEYEMLGKYDGIG